MTPSNTLFLYVTDMSKTITFYSEILGYKPVEESADFALFILSTGLAIGLWHKTKIEPAPLTTIGGCELGFKVAHNQEVDRIYNEWQSKGATILLPPKNLDFGRSFVAIDPDGYRLRVYCLVDQ